MARENKEWLDEYMSLKQVNDSNPFTVPEGYFAVLEQHITSTVNLINVAPDETSAGFILPDNYFNQLTVNLETIIKIADTADQSTENFSVPEGYFEELSYKIQSRINIETIAPGYDTGFSIPEERYFDDLPGKIENRIALEDAMANMPEGFTVPANYFDELSNQITSRINVEDAIANENEGFIVPQHYFDELSAQIESRISFADALVQDSGGFVTPENYFEDLTALIQSRVFVEESFAAANESLTAPEGYFDKLTADVLNKTVNVKQQPVRKGIVRKLITSGTFRYATAACFALAIGTGIWINQFNAPEAVHDRSYLHKQLSDIPVGDIENYLEVHVDASDTHALMDNGKSINNDNLDNDLQDYLDSNQ